MLLQEPAPRSQGCEVERVLPTLDTAISNKFPLGVYGKVKWRALKGRILASVE
jgi:hypothetical protein